MLKFNPNCVIKYHCDNVKKPEFGVPFVSKFDVVMNALDNLAARRHVNRLCLAAKKPLIESGTTGYLGQVSVHLPHKTECFECTEKPTPKTYPICTLVRPSNNAHAGTVRELSLTGHLWMVGGGAGLDAKQAHPPRALGQNGVRGLLWEL